MTTAEDLLGFENGRCYVDLPDGKGLSILSAAAADWLREQASYSISAIRGEWSSNEPHASAEDGTWEVCLCDEKGSGLHQGDIPEFDDPENFRVYESDGAFVYGEVPIDIVLDMLEGRGVTLGQRPPRKYTADESDPNDLPKVPCTEGVCNLFDGHGGPHEGADGNLHP